MALFNLSSCSRKSIVNSVMQILSIDIILYFLPTHRRCRFFVILLQIFLIIRVKLGLILIHFLVIQLIDLYFKLVKCIDQLMPVSVENSQLSIHIFMVCTGLLGG